jgi:glutamate-5-semialdehyde dehydrogenase
MTVTSKTIPADIDVVMRDMGVRARAAARGIALAPAGQKRAALLAMAERIRSALPGIVAANAADMARAAGRGLSGSFLDRLRLDEARINAMARGVEEIAGLADPVGRVLATWTQPNGLVFERVATPLGVVGVVFESRPNVTADAGALCLAAGNAVILRGGSDGFESSMAIHGAISAGLQSAGLSPDVIQMVPSTDRAAVGAMLSGLNGNLDVLVPRGGKALVERVQNDARVPVFSHLEGNCHVYIHAKADPAKALSITLNAKMRRTGVCGSAETLLVDRAALSQLKPLVQALFDKGCAVRGDGETLACDPRVTPASEADWACEYLDAIIAVKVVESIDDAMAHIARYGSSHTEAIVTEDTDAARRFLAEVDSAIVLHNASTQFADGGEFGFGGEIGIATGRLHARGPVGVEQLCSFKYRVHGTGQIRP